MRKTQNIFQMYPLLKEWTSYGVSITGEKTKASAEIWALGRRIELSSLVEMRGKAGKELWIE